MEKDKKKKKTRKFLGLPLEQLFLMIIFVATGIYIQKETAVLMFARQDYWKEVQSRFRSDSIPIPAERGKLLSCDGKVLVASVPKYRLALDYVVVDANEKIRKEVQAKRNTLLAQKKDSLAQGLARLYPEHTVEWYANRIEEGQRRKERSWNLLGTKEISYLELLECEKLPYLKERRGISGFAPEKIMYRTKVYGSLASQTLGAIRKVEDKNTKKKTGLEACYDSILQGKDGYKHREKVRGKFLTFVDIPVQNGHDIMTTIDIRMQDIVEKALRDRLTALELDNSITAPKNVTGGVAILMEVETGDIKAIANMKKIDSPASANGFEFLEGVNDALNAMWEPGSTFKTASMMVAMEDGHITPETEVFCEGGIGVKNGGQYRMYGQWMKDHKRGGYGTLTMTQVLEQSSNIGISKIIDKYYHDKPEEFVQGLYDIGVGIPLGIPMGTAPNVRMPQRDSRGRLTGNWYKTTLPWMSIGYESQIPPINTLAFYNAIANNGRFVRPRFVKAEIENGKIVREFPVVVLKEKICSDQTLSNIQMMLESVVSNGLGHAAGNNKFKVSGKTGTAKMALNGGGYGRDYMVSFCGYFPSDAPKYSCIVCITENSSYPSGGGHCGPVFRNISSMVMNDGNGRNIALASDSTSIYESTLAPTITDKEKSELKQQKGIMPDVSGMGARDAVELLQTDSLTVKLEGQGHVSKQSIAAGKEIQAGQTITLQLK